MSRSQATSLRNARRPRRGSLRPDLESLEDRQLLANFLVTTTSDTPVTPSPDVPRPMTLRQAMTAANANPGPDTITFGLIPKNIPGVIDYNAIFEAWTIHVDSALPTITDLVSIDGYSQRIVSPQMAGKEVQTLDLTGPPGSGTFTLTFQSQTTAPIPYNATQDVVQAALEDLSSIGAGNVSVVPDPSNLVRYTITFQNKLGYSNVDPVVPVSTNLFGGTAVVTTRTQGASGTITSDQNALAIGFNAAVRVIIDGSVSDPVTGALVPASFPGLTIQSDHNRIRGLSIDGFSTGVAVQGSSAIGNLIQGDYLGHYLRYINPNLLAGVSTTAGIGNSQGVLIAAPSNNSVGGVSPETHNAIAGNLAQGVHLALGADSNQVVGNLIGVLEESPNVYYQVGNGQEGVLVESSTNAIGGAVAGSTNVISANGTYGVHIVGPDAARNRVEANYIGTDISGTFVFGQGNPGNGQDDQFTGNLRDGVFIDNAPNNQIGITGANIGPHTSATPPNIISGNFGAGVRIAGASATGNVVLGNDVGTNLGGTSALPNFQEGVAIFSAGNRIGGLNPGDLNIISGNRRGVLISGSAATGNVIVGNFIGTDGAGPKTGSYDLGNAQEGVRIDSASGNTIGGTVAAARNILSGNNVGLAIVGSAASGNLVLGNLIGTDVTGTLDLPNAQEGVRIEGAPANTVGGSTAGARNVISANHRGVVLTGATATANLVQGDFIGTDITGTLPLGNEVDGVLATNGAANNLVGGAVVGEGNTVAFNLRDGVRIETDGGVGNAILSNRIFSNGVLGIDLAAPGDPVGGMSPNDPGDVDAGPDHLQNFPVLTKVASAVGGAIISGTLNSTPNTIFVVQFFSTRILSPADNGEGGTFLGSTTVQTDGDGNATFMAPVPGLVPAGESVTATATSRGGDTSEFSAGIKEELGTVQFSMSNFSVSEGVGTALIAVTRVGGSGGLFTVDFATQDGTAVGTGSASSVIASDYAASSGTLVFNPGEMSKYIAVSIIDDSLSEPSEYFFLSLNNPSGAAELGRPVTAQITIDDNDQPGTIRFSAAQYLAKEGDGTVAITVERANGSSGAVSIDYATSDATPGAGVDYLPTSGTLVFADRESRKTITITILADNKYEPDQAVRLTLSNPTGGATLGLPSVAILTILDQDAPMHGSFQFSQTGFDTRGGVGQTTITVTRVGGADGTATVDFATSNGTGVAGVDYTAESGTLLFKNGETTKQILIPILDAIDLVGNRTVNVTLSRPTGDARLGAPSTVVLTIHDTIGPSVQGVRFLTDRGGGIVDLVVNFSEPLNAQTAVNLLNYGYSVRTAGRDHRFGTRDDVIIPVRSAIVDASDQTVTLRLGRGIHPPTPFQFEINQSTNVAGAGVGLSDVAGNLLGAVKGPGAGVPFVVILSGRTGGFQSPSASTIHGRSRASARRPATTKAVHSPAPRGPLSHPGQGY